MRLWIQWNSPLGENYLELAVAVAVAVGKL